MFLQYIYIYILCFGVNISQNFVYLHIRYKKTITDFRMSVLKVAYINETCHPYSIVVAVFTRVRL